MLVVFAGDSHGNMPYMMRVLEIAKNAEAGLVIQVGDFGFWPNSTYAKKVGKKFEAAGLPLWVVDGNHDDPVERVKFTAEPTFKPGLTAMPRGAVTQIGTKRVGFMGSAVSVDQEVRMPGRSWWPEEIMCDAEMHTAIRNGPVDVWVTHDAVEIPPVMKPYSFGPKIDAAISEQRFRMRKCFDALKPKLHIHGHWHCRYSAETKYGQVIGLDFEGDNGILLVDFPDIEE